MRRIIIICICLSFSISIHVKAQEFIGAIAGAILGPDDEKCSNCNGAGCSECNGIGTFSTSSDYFLKGFKMGWDMVNDNSSKETSKLNGYHTKEYRDGTYKGNYKNGKMHGQGTILFKNGNKYVGNFVDGHMNGKGTFTYADGDKYVGDFKDDLMHGKGKLTFSDGGSYEGDFRNDNAEGYGTFKLPDQGLKYVGYVKNNVMNGEGTLYFTKEKKYVKGIFKDGDIIQTIDEGTYNEPKKVSQTRKPIGKKSRK